MNEMSESHSVMSDSLQLHELHSPWNSSGQNTEFGSLSLLQGIFSTKRSNSGFPHCRLILYQLSHKGSARILEWLDYPFSSRSSQSRNQTRVSCIAGGFFTNWAIREVQYIQLWPISNPLWLYSVDDDWIQGIRSDRQSAWRTKHRGW